MGHALHDLARHNTWATAQLLRYCQELDEDDLNATVRGTFGTVIKTLRHIVKSEAGYLFRVTGACGEYPWSREEAVGLDVLAERAGLVAEVW